MCSLKQRKPITAHIILIKKTDRLLFVLCFADVGFFSLYISLVPTKIHFNLKTKSKCDATQDTRVQHNLVFQFLLGFCFFFFSTQQEKTFLNYPRMLTVSLSPHTNWAIWLNRVKCNEIEKKIISIYRKLDRGQMNMKNQKQKRKKINQIQYWKKKEETIRGW